MIEALPLLLLLAAAADPLAQGPAVTVTGWSADGTKVSVRAFAYFDEPEVEPVECPGYVDDKGKKFYGSLTLAAYENGKVVQSWLVQDYPTCTPPAKAKEILAAAKAKFAELGIDLTAKAKVLTGCEKGCEVKPGLKLQFKNDTRTETVDDEMQGHIKGPVRLLQIAAAKKTTLFEAAIDETFGLMMGGSQRVTMEPPLLAPNGQTLLVRIKMVFSSGRGGSTTYLMSDWFQVNGQTLEKK